MESKKESIVTEYMINAVKSDTATVQLVNVSPFWRLMNSCS